MILLHDIDYGLYVSMIDYNKFNNCELQITSLEKNYRMCNYACKVVIIPIFTNKLYEINHKKWYVK